MAGRPRTIDDQRIMAAVASAVGRKGPARMTLADVAQDAGVSTGVLTQRYGSKRNLLLAFSGKGLSDDVFLAPMRAIFQAAANQIDGLVEAVVRSAGPDTDPDEFANSLAFLHLELADAEFRGLLAAHDLAIRAELAGWLRIAAGNGHLAADADIEALASAIDSIRNGTQLTWAMTRAGSLADAMRRDLRTLLTPYRTDTTGELS